MKFTLKKYDQKSMQSGLYVLFVPQEKPLCHSTVPEIDKQLSLAVESKEFSGEAGKKLLLYHQRAKFLFVGMGKEAEWTVEKIRSAAGSAVSSAKDLKLTSFSLHSYEKALSPTYLLRGLAEGLLLGNYTFDKYLSEDHKEKKKPIEEVSILLHNPSPAFTKEIERAQIIAGNVNRVRDLVNECTYVVNPPALAEVAKKACALPNTKVTVFDEKKIQALGMNLLLAVSSASKYPPRFIVVEYNGAKNSKEKIAFVGKGITFDSGGLNLKPTGYIETMRQDMAGAATAIFILKTLAELRVPINAVAVVPTCENLIGKGAYKPGDIFVSYSKKTVEIKNTDAEGRLVLGDALGYTVKNIKPSLIIDMATLTGAIVVCLGNTVAGMMTNQEKENAALMEASKATGEKIWQLPIYDEFREAVKSDVADLKNVGFEKGAAGSITASTFLEAFVEKTPWIHLDIAGTAWADKANGYVPKYGTGFGLRLLVEFVERKAKHG